MMLLKNFEKKKLDLVENYLILTDSDNNEFFKRINIVRDKLRLTAIFFNG